MFTRFVFFWPPTPLRLHFLRHKSLQKVDFFDHLPPSSCKRSLWTAPKWIIGHTKWIFLDFLDLALVEYRTKWIHIMRGPSARILKWIRQHYILHMTNENRTIVFSCTFVPFQTDCQEIILWKFNCNFRNNLTSLDLTRARV